MRQLSNYIFFQAYRWYVHRKDGAPDFMAMLVLTLIQHTTLFNIVDVVLMTFGLRGLPMTFIVLSAVIIGLINYFIYCRNFNADDTIRPYKDLPASKLSRDGWLMVVYITVTLIGVIIIGSIRAK